jgi:ATP-dependent DNA helicase RecQ
MTKPKDILRQYWGYDEFRSLQEDIIQSVLDKKDSLALLPTGGGKSICFQVPAMAQAGMAIVISPLIALMKDQVENLVKRGIAAAYLNSSMEPQEVDHVLQQAMDGAFKLLYLAPERLKSEMFRLRLPKMPVSMLVVDEAHCISQWGYDFRPSYMEITFIREQKPNIPIIALTASATPQVQVDIQDKLKLNSPAIFRKSFRRDNLRYFVLQEENVTQRILTICKRTLGSGIIYVRTRKRTTALAKFLQENGISAAPYHGGLSTSERDTTQQAWIEGVTRIIVATNAFGMGIDKPDVRFVLHFNLPFDLESYYQEAGRGGRDGDTALAIAFHNPADIAEATRWVKDKYPSWDQLRQHYDFLCSHFNIPFQGTVYERFEFDIRMLAQKAGEPLLKLYNSIRLLDREGLLKLEEETDDYGLLRVKSSPNNILRYKETHPFEGEVLEYALRTLGGETYHYDMRFLPGHWALKMGISIADLQQRLNRLVQHQMIYYQVPRTTPMISFFEPRRRLNPADLDWPKYEFLRKQSDYRFAQMLAYLTTTEICRSLFIQQYFGEKAHEPCGKCDVCIGRYKTKVSDSDFKTLLKLIMQQVRNQSLTYRQVVLEIKQGTPAQREKVLRYLLDQKLILISEDGQLKATSTS